MSEKTRVIFSLGTAEGAVTEARYLNHTTLANTQQQRLQLT